MFIMVEKSAQRQRHLLQSLQVKAKRAKQVKPWQNTKTRNTSIGGSNQTVLSRLSIDTGTKNQASSYPMETIGNISSIERPCY